jgi:hypothetical protein
MKIARGIAAGVLVVGGAAWLAFSAFMMAGSFSDTGGWSSLTDASIHANGGLSISNATSYIEIHPIFWVTIALSVAALVIGVSILTKIGRRHVDAKR